MAKEVERLSDIEVAKKTKVGLYPDGGGLYLRVGPNGVKNWAFRYMLGGKPQEMGLGGFNKVPLADARRRASEARGLLADCMDPIEHCQQQAQTQHRAAKELVAARSMTFDDCRDAYLRAHGANWRNLNNRKQWINTLSTYVTPVFGSIPVHDVDITLITKVIAPLWSTKPQTASLIRGRIETVLEWAKGRGFRTGENPARWRGHLDQLLPALSSVRTIEPHAALPYEELGSFMKDLQGRTGASAVALQLLILTAARTEHVLGAHWPEIDFANRLWTIPAGRTKNCTEHRVPLAEAALVLLKSMKGRGEDLIFSSVRTGKPLAANTMRAVLKRMNRGDITAHGFRSTFRRWAAECTSFSHELVEMALAYTMHNKVETAYPSEDFFDKRRRLMNAWSDFCNGR